MNPKINHSNKIIERRKIHSIKGKIIVRKENYLYCRLPIQPFGFQPSNEVSGRSPAFPQLLLPHCNHPHS